MTAVHLILYRFMELLWSIWRFACVWSTWIVGNFLNVFALTNMNRSLDRISKTIGGPIPVDIMSKITHAVCPIYDCC